MDWDSSRSLVLSLVKRSHHTHSSASLPTAAVSSAYQVCLELPLSLLITGMVARAYMGMASGSPCVIPSWESRVSPSTSSSVGALYLLISEPPDVLESNLTVQGIECVGGFNQEHCFGVTGVKGGSYCVQCSFDARNLSPRHLEASWLLGLVTDSTAFAKILRAVSIPNAYWSDTRVLV